jgi:hypothetical protein
MLIYGFIALPAGEHIADRLAGEVFAAPLVSGAVVHVTLGALLLVLAIVCQALEVVRSVRPSNAALAENMVSVILWIAGLILFLLVRGFGTNEFFIMLLLLLTDYMTGIVVMVFTARRTIGTALN